MRRPTYLAQEAFQHLREVFDIPACHLPGISAVSRSTWATVLQSSFNAGSIGVERLISAQEQLTKRFPGQGVRDRPTEKAVLEEQSAVWKEAELF